MQPYAGKGRGMQFPMAKGTEVLLTFVDGDPDRPLIAGAINTAAAPGPVTASNQTESVIQTGGNNRIRFEDQAGSERIILETPSAGSWIRVGAPNDPEPIEDLDSGSGIRIQSSANVWLESGFGYGDYHGGTKPTSSTDTAPPNAQALINYFLSPNLSYNPKGLKNYVGGGYVDTAAEGLLNAAIAAEATAKNNYDTAAAAVKTAAAKVMTAQNYLNGLPDNNSPSRTNADYAVYHRAEADLANAETAFARDRATQEAKKVNHDAAIAETASKKTAAINNSTLADIIDTNRVHLQVSAMDTITTQEGNIYDFGGYWNYNLGNSYAEDHIKQDADLNMLHTVSFPADGTSNYNPLAIVGTLGPMIASIGVATAIGAAAGAGSPPSLSTLAMTSAALAVGGIVVSSISMPVHDAASGNKDLSDLLSDPDKSGDAVIKTPTDRVKASKIATDGKLTQLETNMTAGTTWVSKTFGDAYSFNQGNSIEISHGNTEEHSTGDSHDFVYGGTHEETKYNGKGIMTSWSESGSGESKELSFNPLDGSFTKFEYKSSNAMLFSFEAAVATMPKLDLSIALSNMHTTLGLSAGMRMEVEAALGLSVSMKYNAGFAIEMESNAATKAEFDWETKAFVLKGPGTQFDQKAAIEAELQKMVMSEHTSFIDKGKIKLEKGEMTLGDKKLTIGKGMLFQGV
jgi:hypothetical protein